MKRDKQLATAVRGFFERNEFLCPEAMILEIQHIRDEHISKICEFTPIGEAKVTYQLLTNVCFLIQECSENKKA